MVHFCIVKFFFFFFFFGTKTCTSPPSSSISVFVPTTISSFEPWLTTAIGKNILPPRKEIYFAWSVPKDLGRKAVRKFYFLELFHFNFFSVTGARVSSANIVDVDFRRKPRRNYARRQATIRASKRKRKCLDFWKTPTRLFRPLFATFVARLALFFSPPP